MCPDGCTTGTSSCNSCSTGTSDVFDVKFYQNKDIQVKAIDGFEQTTDFTGSGVISRTDPSPTKERGYYFVDDSSFTSEQEFVPGLNNVLIYWVRPQEEGRIATMQDSVFHYKVEMANNRNWTATTMYTSTVDGSYKSRYLNIEKVKKREWHKVNVEISQDDPSTCTLRGLVNGNLINATTIQDCWLTFQYGLSTPLRWIIGKKDTSSFKGHLYRVILRNSHLDGESMGISEDLFDGSCIFQDYECNEEHEDPWICKQGECESGVTVQGICMFDCPYGLDCGTHMDSLPDTPVMNVNFDQDYSSYKHLFQSGVDPDTYHPNNPEDDDVIPLQGRGVYYNHDRFLRSVKQVYLYHTFTIRMWVYHISGAIVKKESQLLIDDSGMTLELQNVFLSYESVQISNSVPHKTWTEIGFSCKFSFDTTLKAYKAASLENSITKEDMIFRHQKFFHFQVGGFAGEGMIYNIKLWQNEIDISTETIPPSPPNTCNYDEFDPGCNSCISCTPSTGIPSCSSTIQACSSSPGQYSCAETHSNCNNCYEGCKKCNGTEYNECISCMGGYFLVYGMMCVEECPTGMKLNVPDRECQYKDGGVIVGSRLSLEAAFNNYIKLNGALNFGKDFCQWNRGNNGDPHAMKLRGYYFTKNSYASQNLTMGPQFTVVGWIRLKENNGILLDKGYTHSILHFNSGNLVAKVETKSEIVSLTSTSDFMDVWTYFSVSTEILGTGKTKVVLKVNNSQEDDYETLVATFFIDKKDTSHPLRIGGTSGDSFEGFLWSFKIYNIHGMDDFATTGCPSECSGFCPTELICPSYCEFDHYPDGTGCSPCKSGCNKGCVRPENCDLCDDDLCDECNYFSYYTDPIEDRACTTCGAKVCSGCKKNAKTVGDKCECKITYYKEPSDKECHDCTDNCDRCSSHEIDKCTECSSGYYLTNNVCNSFCPTGYNKLTKTCVLVDDFVFQLKPERIEDVVEDTRSAIPVLTGKDNNFYPTYTTEDPWAARHRGYYFTGSSVMQLPPYGSTTDPKLVIAPQFAITFWLFPLNPTSTIFAKQDDSSFDNNLRLWMYYGQPSIDIKVSSTETLSGSVDLATGWNFLGVRLFIDSDSNYKLEMYVNNTLCGLSNFGGTFYKELSTDFYASIGARQSAMGVFEDFFKGFIWEMRVYNSPRDLLSLLETTCDSCSFCPVENNNKCLPVCSIDQFWTGNSCENCDLSCTQGCVRKETCNLCENNLCYKCTGYLEGDCLNCIAGITGPPCKCSGGLGLDPQQLTCIPCDSSLNQEEVDSICVCKEGFYNADPSGIDCQPCNMECKQCSPGELNCVECVPEYSYIGSFGDCVCPSNSNLQDSECVCEAGYYMECIPDCENMQKSVCSKCHESCKTCSGPLESQCTSCKGMALEDGFCRPCEEGYYANLDNRCAKCKSLCKACTTYSDCTECVKNASFKSEDVCVCNPGYSEGSGQCMPNYFYASLVVDEDNILYLNFTKNLTERLNETKVSVDIENYKPSVDFSVKTLVSNTSFIIKPKIEEKVEEKQEITVTFEQVILSTDNDLLFNETVKGYLTEYDPDQEIEDRTKEITQILVGIALGISATANILNFNASTFWSLVNVLQILMYIPITNNRLTPRLIGFFKGLNLLVLIPNVFEWVFGDYYNNHSRSREYGFDNALFLTNMGQELTILVLIMLIWPFIFLGSKLFSGSFGNKLTKMHKEYKFGVFIRFWIEAYLEVCMASLIQIYSIGERNFTPIFNSMVALVGSTSVLLTPLLGWKFLTEYSKRIQDVEDKPFYKVWGSLYYELKLKPSAKYFYVVFLVRRLLYSLSVMLLGSFSLPQGIIDAVLMTMFFVYFVSFAPFSDKFLQAVNSVTELGIAGIFGCIIYFIVDEEGTYDHRFEFSVIYCGMFLVFIQVVASVVIFCVTLYRIVKGKASGSRSNLPKSRIVLDTPAPEGYSNLNKSRIVLDTPPSSTNLIEQQARARHASSRF